MYAQSPITLYPSVHRVRNAKQMSPLLAVCTVVTQLRQCLPKVRTMDLDVQAAGLAKLPTVSLGVVC